MRDYEAQLRADWPNWQALASAHRIDDYFTCPICGLCGFKAGSVQHVMCRQHHKEFEDWKPNGTAYHFVIGKLVDKFYAHLSLGPCAVCDDNAAKGDYLCRECRNVP